MRKVGWILANNAGDRRHLTSLGVVVGKWNRKVGQFEGCVVSQEALDRLDPYWGRYYWGLK